MGFWQALQMSPDSLMDDPAAWDITISSTSAKFILAGGSMHRTCFFEVLSGKQVLSQKALLHTTNITICLFFIVF